MEVKDVFIGKARKYNCYAETQREPQHSKEKRLICHDCVRWRFSFPYTCNDYEMYGNKAETCLNYTNDFKCKVD